MKKYLVLVTTLSVALFLAACGPSEPTVSENGGEAAAVEATPTQIVLATPTPRPAPPTPTLRPTPAPLESAEEEAPAEEEVTEAEEVEEAERQITGPLSEEMVEIPAGPFTMGQDGSKPKNGPAYEVDLPAYEIDRFEVTNGEYALFAEQTGYVTYAEEQGSNSWRNAAADKENHPAVYITWNDAVAYCEWAGKRLPTEAEWEKAARSDDGRLYPWGDEYPTEDEAVQFGNLYETGLRDTFPVGGFEQGASPYGVYDMAGNVREWVQDSFLPYPGAAADADPFFGEENKVNRGGGWFDGQDGELVTTYNRNAGPPDTSANDDIGFRCARDVQ